jgi:hypothetical protein
MFFPAARTTLRTAAGIARRGYADVADGSLKLSLVLPHQVGQTSLDRGGDVFHLSAEACNTAGWPFHASIH